ncbi:helix-turn-helix transcriptional regulator [Pyxidicoccus sp. 3LG]
MSAPRSRTAHEDALREQILLSLYDSPCLLPDVLERTRDALLQLIPADYMGLCILTPGQPVEFEWLVPGPRVALLEQYGAVAKHDFMRKALVHQLDVVKRDSEIIPRKELERHPLYQLSRELEPRLEHVTAVLLPVSPGVFAAFAFYRIRRRPFTEKNSADFQKLTGHLVRMVRNCLDFATAATGDQLMEELNKRQDAEVIVVRPPARERMRSPGATALLKKWFDGSGLHRSGLPQVLAERLDALVRMNASERLGADSWVDWRDEEHLLVRFIELREPDGPSAWALRLHEFSHSIPIPDEIARELSPRQLEVAQGILRNWQNKQIASELGCAPGTVKAHVRDIFKELKCDGRLDFMYQAARFLKPV